MSSSRSSQNQNQNTFQTTSGSSSTTPWEPQANYVLDAFNRAQNAYNQTMGTGAYQGDYVATDNGQGANAYNAAYNFGMSPEASNALYGNLTGQGTTMLNQGVAANTAGLSGLEGLSGDQTQNIINNAGQYANNPYIEGALNAAMRDANRQAAENTLPNLYRSAASSNALNSDRAALGQGVVERGLAELAGNLSANMRYNAYNQGINTAQSEMDARRQSYGALSQLGQGSANQGTTGLSQGLENQSRLLQLASAGATGNQGLRQDQLDNAMAQYEGKTNFPWQALNNYYNIIGNRSWGNNTNFTQTSNGNTQTQTQQTQQPSVTDVIGGSLLGGSSILGRRANGSTGLFGWLGG